jgi:hypothetical protein
MEHYPFNKIHFTACLRNPVEYNLNKIEGTVIFYLLKCKKGPAYLGYKFVSFGI